MRPVARKVFKLQRQIKNARHEIVQCNVEARRVLTAIQDEEVHFTQVLAKLKELSNPIYGAVEEFITRRRHINMQLHKRIQQIHALKGFSGNSTPGRCFGSSSPVTTTLGDEDVMMNEGSIMHRNILPLPLSQGLEVETEDADDHAEEADRLQDEDVQRDISGLIQFFDTLIV